MPRMSLVSLAAWSASWLLACTYGDSAPTGGWAPGALPAEIAVNRSCPSIARVNIAELSPQDFRKHFLEMANPVILEGATTGWPALEHWQKADFLGRYGHLKAKIGNATDVVLFAGGWHYHRSLGQMPVSDFMGGFSQAGSGGPSELDRPFLFDSRGLFKDESIRADFWIPAAFESSFGTGRPAAEAADQRTWPVLSLGEGGAGLPFHNHGDAWLALVYGDKHWFLYPPGTGPVASPQDERDLSAPPPGLASSRHWAQTVYPTLSEQDKPIECTQQAGELLFVPRGWSHATLNIGESIAVGGQLEWGPIAKEMHASQVLELNPHDFHGHKDLATAIGAQLDVPNVPLLGHPVIHPFSQFSEFRTCVLRIYGVFSGNSQNMRLHVSENWLKTHVSSCCDGWACRNFRKVWFPWQG